VRGGPPVEISLTGAAAALPPPMRDAIRQALADACTAGGPRGFPVVDVRAELGEVAVSDAPDPMVPLLASVTMALRRALAAATTVLLEPVMRLDVRVPEEFLGAVVKDLSTRRAEIRETGLAGRDATVRALVPLAEMFGYSTHLRSLSQGRGSFSMEPYDYQPVPEHVAARNGLV